MSNSNNEKTFKVLTLALFSCGVLAGCGSLDRLENIGKAPETTKIANPTTQPEYQPVSLPMPAPKEISMGRNSLWSSDRQTFFKDQRASDVGDIITVLINISDEAELENETSRSRNASEGLDTPALLGYANELDRIFNEDITDENGVLQNTNILDTTSNSNHTGSGTTEREEEITVQLAAIVTQELPNGNLVINGRQEVVVNFEKRLLLINGIIRPEDITINNTISSEQIAEARIAYGGEGQITDMQQPRYGQQLYDIIFPF